MCVHEYPQAARQSSVADRLDADRLDAERQRPPRYECVNVSTGMRRYTRSLVLCHENRFPVVRARPRL